MFNRIPTLTIVAVLAIVIGQIAQFFPLIVLGVIALVISVIGWVRRPASRDVP